MSTFNILAHPNAHFSHWKGLFLLYLGCVGISDDHIVFYVDGLYFTGRAGQQTKGLHYTVKMAKNSGSGSL
jgi:hypothetical protein